MKDQRDEDVFQEVSDILVEENPLGFEEWLHYDHTYERIATIIMDRLKEVPPVAHLREFIHEVVHSDEAIARLAAQYTRRCGVVCPF